jgi:hypothetical protein
MAIGRDRRIVKLDGPWYKNQAARARRRAERRDPEGAPTKRAAHRGWVA